MSEQYELSVEETVAVVMIVNLVVLTPITPLLDYDQKHSLEYIVQKLYAHHGCKGYHFDVDIFGQALHHNHLWLQRKLNWDVFSYNTTLKKIKALGSWPEVKKRYELTMRTPHTSGCNFAYSAHAEQCTQQIQHNRMTLLNFCLKWQIKARSNRTPIYNQQVNLTTGSVSLSALATLLPPNNNNNNTAIPAPLLSNGPSAELEIPLPRQGVPVQLPISSPVVLPAAGAAGHRPNRHSPLLLPSHDSIELPSALCTARNVVSFVATPASPAFSSAPSVPPQSEQSISPKHAVAVATEDSARECRQYCAFLVTNQCHNLTFFATQPLPTLHTRLCWVKAYMPMLYGSVFSAQLSQHFKRQVSIVNNMKSRSHLPDSFSDRESAAERRAKQIEHAALEACENAAFMNAGGTVLTCSVVITAMLLALGGTTRRVRDLLSARRMSLNSTTTGTLLNRWLLRQEDLLKHMVVQITADPQKVLLVIADNYCTQQWPKAKLVDRAFTHAVATVSVMFGQVSIGAGNNSNTAASEKPIARKYNVSEIVEVLSGDGIILSERSRLLRDTESVKYQGLKNFRIHSSLDAKSSSYDDTEEKLVQQLLLDECRLGQKPVVLLADTEYLLSVYRTIFLSPERLRNLFLAPPIFHIRMHVVQNLMSDPLYLLLFVLPYYYSIGLQPESCKQKVWTVIQAIEAGMAKVDAAVAAAAAEAEAHAASGRAPREATNHRRAQNRAQDVSSIAQNLAEDASSTAQNRAEDASSTAQDGTDDDFVRSAESELRAEGHFDAHIEIDVTLDDIEDDEFGPAPPADAAMLTDAEWRRIYNTLYNYVTGGYRAKNVGNAYKDKKAMQVNYARGLFSALVADQAFCSLNLRELGANGTWASDCLIDFLLNGIHKLAVSPFSNIILHGNAVPFLEHLHTMTQYLAHCERDKVVRSLMTIAAAQINARDHHSWLHDAYMQQCSLFNDNHIENLNGTIRNYLPRHCLFTPAIISRTALLTQLRRDFLPTVQEEAGVKVDSSSRGRGEVYHEETKPTRGIYKNEHIHAAEVIKQRIAHLKRHPVLRAHSPIANNMHLMSGACANGAKRMRDVIGPKYEMYLQNELHKQNRHQQQRGQGGGGGGGGAGDTAEDTDVQQLGKYPKQALYFFLRDDQKIRGCSAWNKPELISKIVSLNAKGEFLSFVVQNNIRTAADAATYGRLKGSVDHRLETEQQRREAGLGGAGADAGGLVRRQRRRTTQPAGQQETRYISGTETDSEEEQDRQRTHLSHSAESDQHDEGYDNDAVNSDDYGDDDIFI